MKNKIIFILFLNTTINYCQTINIPDVNFKSRLLQSNTTNYIAQNLTGNNIVVDTNGDGEIQQSEALIVGYLYLHSNAENPSTQISSLEGINYFTNLKWLALNNNNLTSLDISQLINLWNFGCTNNHLTNINFTGLVNLKRVFLSGNLFASLDFSGNPVFNELQCSNNPNLTTIKINNNFQQTFTQTNPWEPINWANVPNLTTICADSFEVSALQTFLASCNITQPINIVTNCALGNPEFEITSFSIYPNPSTGVFILEFASTIENAEIQIFNILGQKVYLEKITQATISKTINLENLSKGTYLIKFIENSKVSYNKLVIE